MRKPNKKQDRFILEYLQDSNASNAAIRAGYSKKTARQIGSRLLTKANIKAKLAASIEKQTKRLELSADTILRELLLIARADIGAAFDEDGKLLPIKEIPEETRRAISGIDTETRRDVTDETAGEADEVTVRKVRFWDKPKALEALGRHLKLFTDVVEHGVTDKLAERLALAVQRAKERRGE